MGLLDKLLSLDVGKVAGNDAFQLGMGILGNNQGYYGDTGMALGAGLKDYQRQKSLQAQQNRANALAKQREAQITMQKQMYGQQQERRSNFESKFPQLSGMPVEYQNAFMKQQFRAPKAPSAFDQKLNLYRKDPKAYKSMYPGQQVNISNKIRSVDDEILLDDRREAGKNARSYVNTVIDTGINSNQMLEKTNQMIDLINRGATTGFGEDYLIQAKQLLTQFGVEYPELAGQEQLQTLMGDYVMARVQETKGAVSEMEMKLFKEYSSNTSKSKHGNLAILDFNRQKLSRNAEMSKIAVEMQGKGMRAAEIRAELLRYRNANPIQRYARPTQNEYNYSEQEEADYQAYKKQRVGR